MILSLKGPRTNHPGHPDGQYTGYKLKISPPRGNVKLSGDGLKC